MSPLIQQAQLLGVYPVRIGNKVYLMRNGLWYSCYTHTWNIDEYHSPIRITWNAWLVTPSRGDFAYKYPDKQQELKMVIESCQQKHN